MSVSKTFVCDHCNIEGKIVIKTEDIGLHDITYCPICGADIQEEDED